MKHHIAIISALLALTSSAAVPVRWTVETSRVQPAQIEAYHGETLRLEAALQSYGKPFEPTNTMHAIYWQTNGMDSAYWTGPAVISNNVLLAEWTPAMDVGATVYQGFIGSPGEIYRASFQLRLRPSPGAAPAELQPPVKTLDFATVEVSNAPYYTRGETDAKIIELAPAPGNYETVSNRAMTALQSYTETDPTAVKTNGSNDVGLEWKITGHVDEYTGHGNIIYFWQTAPHVYPLLGSWVFNGKSRFADEADRVSWSGVTGKPDIPTDSTVSGWGYIKSESDPTVPTWAKAAQKPTYNWSEIGSKPSWIGNTKPTYNWSEIGSKPTIPTDSTVSGWGYIKNESDPTVAAAIAPVETTVNAWQTYWDGDDVRVTVTNYYGSQDLPSLYLEQKISEGGTNYFKTIWTEKARLNPINKRLDDLETDVATKADRAWGFYDSHSGTWAPDGFTSISSGSILISKDMSYQKNITAGGEVWVLTSNDPTVISGTETNGFFKIADSEGNSIFEVVKGDKRVVPATVSAVTAGGNSLTINFNVVSTDHPSLEICSDLVEADWKAEDEASCPATVAWSGSSGNYVATVTGKAAMPKMFVKGTYEVGGETYIKNSAPLGFEKVVIGGVYYRVAVETVNGRKLMVLTED